MDDLKDRFRVRAVSLFGYGKTPAWSDKGLLMLDDRAGPVQAVIDPIVASFLGA